MKLGVGVKGLASNIGNPSSDVASKSGCLKIGDPKNRETLPAPSTTAFWTVLGILDMGKSSCWGVQAFVGVC